MVGLLTFVRLLAAVNRHSGDIHEVPGRAVMVKEPICANPTKAWIKCAAS